MSMPFPLFLAIKYLRPKRSVISVISVISVLGVMIGVAVLVIVLSVMSGFDEMWSEKILGFDAHIVVAGRRAIHDPDALAVAVEGVEGVSAVAPFVQGLVLLRHGSAMETPVLRGVDPGMERRVSRIPEHMVAGAFSLEEDEILLGRHLAARLGVGVGDKVLVYSPQQFVERDEITLPEELRVAGVFEMGMWEYDVGFALAALPLACDLFNVPDGAQALRVMTRDPGRAGVTARLVREAIEAGWPDCTVRTWMELNRQLFGALTVEKNMMFFLLIFIILVAAFGIVNTLIVVAVQKTRAIGLLKALGFSSGSVMRVFFWQGAIQGVAGTSLGLAFGLLVLRNRNAIMRWMSSALDMELFPEALYHLSEIPSRVLPADLARVAVLAIGICTLSGLFAAHRAARLDPSQALRYE